MKSDVLKRNRGLVLCVCVCVLRWCWGDSLILCVSSLSSGARVISLQLECAASFHPDVIFDKLRTHKTNDIYFRANRLIKSATADWLKSCFEFDFDFFFFFALKELQKTLLDFTFICTYICLFCTCLFKHFIEAIQYSLKYSRAWCFMAALLHHILWAFHMHVPATQHDVWHLLRRLHTQEVST